MQQQPEAANASPTQNTMPAPAPDGGAMDWQASKSDTITDIAAIQPTLSNLEEEKIDIAASALMNTKVTTSKPAAKFCGPDTTISFQTSVDTETDIEHRTKPFEAGFSISLLKSQIRRAHQLDDSQDFQLCSKASRQLVDFDEVTTQSSSLLAFDNEQYVLALLNPRYRPEQDAMEIAKASGKEQPVNLEQQIKLDPNLTVVQKEAAIKKMLKTQFPDIVKDKIGGSKYNCFSTKCRKTFPHLKPLFEHQKIHLQNYRPFACTHPGCSKTFMSKGHLRNHAETHQQQKNFVCPIAGCNESYSRQQRLKVHLKKHNGTRDFVCPFENCQKAFYEKGNLKTHLRLHTGEKPYHCQAKDCNKSFATQGHLNDHFLKTHQLGNSGTNSMLAESRVPQAPLKPPTPLQGVHQMLEQHPPVVSSVNSQQQQPPSQPPPQNLPKQELSQGAGSNNANLSSGFVDSSMFTGIQMQLYNQIKLTDINQCNNEGPQKPPDVPRQQLFQQQSSFDQVRDPARIVNQVMPAMLQMQQQNSMGPATRPVQQMNDIGKGVQPTTTVNDKSLAGSMQTSIMAKRKQTLKINIKAANNVADDSNFYNQTNSVPKPVDIQSVNIRRDLDESKSMVHENAIGSAGKKEISTDYMPNFFSFKDYKNKTAQVRGAQTCKKLVGNRTLNPPTPIKANPEVHLDSQSHSQSQGQSQQSKQQMSNALVAAQSTLKEAFGLKPKKSKPEFVMPAQTPLNPRQLAKRRFFSNEEETRILDHQSDQMMNNENGAAGAHDNAIDEAQMIKKREVKMNEKVEQQFNQAIRNAMNMSYNQSVGLKSVEAEASQIHQQNSVQNSGPTFDPKLNRGHGLNKTPSMSQASHVLGDIQSSLAIGSQQPQIQAHQKTITGDETVNNTQERAKVPLSPQQSKHEEKNSEQSNVLTLRDLKVISNQEIESSKKDNAMESKTKEMNNLSSYRDSQQMNEQQFGILPLLSYAQATATAIKQPTNTGLFFGQPQQANFEFNKPFSCQKLPDRHQPAFFNSQVPNSESKQTPQICDTEQRSENSVSQNALKTLEQHQKLMLSQRMQMQNNYNSSVGSHVQLTPLQSQNLSQTQKSFNFQQAQNTSLNVINNKQPGQQILASPLVSNDSNMPSQALLNQHQLAKCHQNGQAVRNMVASVMQNRSSSGSKGVGGSGNQRDNNQIPKISSSLTDRSPSSIGWNKSQQLVSPISHNLSNPSVFFSHTLNNYGGATSNNNAFISSHHQQTGGANNTGGNQQQFQFKVPIQQQLQMLQKQQQQTNLQQQQPQQLTNSQGSIPHPQAQQHQVGTLQQQQQPAGAPQQQQMQQQSNSPTGSRLPGPPNQQVDSQALNLNNASRVTSGVGGTALGNNGGQGGMLAPPQPQHQQQQVENYGAATKATPNQLRNEHSIVPVSAPAQTATQQQSQQQAATGTVAQQAAPIEEAKHGHQPDQQQTTMTYMANQMGNPAPTVGQDPPKQPLQQQSTAVVPPSADIGAHQQQQNAVVKETTKHHQDEVMEGSAAPADGKAEAAPTQNASKPDVKMMDEELKMTNAPGEEASNQGLIGHGSLSPSKTQGLLTSTFRNEKDGSKQGSQSGDFKRQQLDLMKKKCRYQQKLQKIEYQMQVQNQQVLQKAMMHAQSANYFFAEPVVPPDHTMKMQAAPPMAQSTISGMLQGSPWLNPWQQQRQQQYLMQQAALADNHNQLQQQLQHQFPNIVSPGYQNPHEISRSPTNQYLAVPSPAHPTTVAPHVYPDHVSASSYAGSVNLNPSAVAAAPHQQILSGYYNNASGAPMCSSSHPLTSPIIGNQITAGLNLGLNEAAAPQMHQISPHPQSIQQFFAENQFMQQMQQQSARTSQQQSQQVMQLANLIQQQQQLRPSKNQIDPNVLLSNSSSSLSNSTGGIPGTLHPSNLLAHLPPQPNSGGNSTAGFQQQKPQNAKSGNARSSPNN